MSKLSHKFEAESYIQETPAGLIDSENTSFTLTHTPADPGDVLVTLNGLNRSEFTVAGTTLSMGFAPAPGQKLVVYYSKE